MRARLVAGFDRLRRRARQERRRSRAAAARAGDRHRRRPDGATPWARAAAFSRTAPAPIQVNYLGYPGTMGARFIDYIVADRFVIPAGDEAHYTERVVALPDCYQANDATRAIAERTSEPREAGLPDDGFVFCCFNNKLQDHAAGCSTSGCGCCGARRRQRAVAARRQPSGRAQSAAEARRAASTPRALVFAPQRAARGPSCAASPRRSLPRHAAVQRAYDGERRAVGGSAARDLRRQDVRRPRSRQPAARGRAAGARHRQPRRVRGARAGARALARVLHGLRDRLLGDGHRSALFDIGRFGSHIESAYSAMWEIYRRGDTPRAFDVPAVSFPKAR